MPGSATGPLTFDVVAELADGSTPARAHPPVTQVVSAGASPTIYVALACGGKPCVPAGAGGGPDGGTTPQPNCGNGLVDSGETCDIAIPAGMPGACPTSCRRSRRLHGRPAALAQHLSGLLRAPPVTAAVGGDGCCPTGANASTDPDCSSTCGNGTIEPGETCDTAIAGRPARRLPRCQ